MADGDFFESLGNTFIYGLERGIDNATRSEPQPSPNTQTGADRNVVTTNQHGTGLTKEAGTGAQILPGVNNTALLIGGAAIAGLVVLLVAMRR